MKIFYSDLQPMPLTEELLLNFGFIEQKINSAKKNYWNKEFDFSIDVEFTFIKDKLLLYYLVYNQERRKNIQYVHHLQNLYYALTQKELCLK